MLPVHAWCTFEHRFRNGTIIKQAEPLFPNVYTALKYIHKVLPFEVKRTEGFPGWYDWKLFLGIRSKSLPTWTQSIFYFRGQQDTRYNLFPTMYRGLLKPDEAIKKIKERKQKELEIVKTIFDNRQIKLIVPQTRQFSYAQKLAVARHYGAPSELIDFTASPDVAGFFASRSINKTDKIGIIYILNVIEMLSLPGLGGFDRGEREFGGLMFIPTGPLKLTWLEPDPLFSSPPHEQSALFYLNSPIMGCIDFITVPFIHRIEAQKAVFLRIHHINNYPKQDIQAICEYYDSIREFWTLMRFLCRKVCFLQTDEIYQNPDIAITEDEILSPHDDIENLLKLQAL